MMEKGLLAEVEGLVKMGYGFNLPSMSGLGYKQIGMFFQGEIDLTTAIQKIKSNTHRFVRHQNNWFRLHDERIHWFDIRQEIDQAVRDLIERFSAKQHAHH